MSSELNATLDSNVAVHTQGLCKQYRLGQIGSVASLARRVLGRYGPVQRRPFPALADIAFTAHRGETVGVVGANGSGKSTLLQLLAGTTMPTAGRITIRGRVLPLLAVGQGFHPELTGRENVLLFGASLGVPTQALREQVDAVLDFADVREHADTPVKRFSTGMISRLSVAVAVCVPADIYIFDEVLAVVDHDFQSRCIDEIRRLHERGATVFFVSHNQSQVRQVAQRVLWLEHGKLRGFGPASELLDEYEATRL
jgi:lipopolysaccharide transport system ATP-binding protein